jgi:hypothetical protein
MHKKLKFYSNPNLKREPINIISQILASGELTRKRSGQQNGRKSRI